MRNISIFTATLLVASVPSFSVVADVTKENCVAGDKFHKAAAKGDSKFIQSCLDAKTPINSVEGNGWTALHAAASNGKVEMVKQLLNAGANSALKDKNGKTPLDLANMKKHQAVVKVFSMPVKSALTEVEPGSPKADKLAQALRFELNNYGPNSSSDSIDYQVVEILSVAKVAADAGASYTIKVKFTTGTADDGTDVIIYEGKIAESADGNLSVTNYDSVDA